MQFGDAVQRQLSEQNILKGLQGPKKEEFERQKTMKVGAQQERKMTLGRKQRDSNVSVKVMQPIK